MPHASAFNDAARGSRSILEERSVFYGTLFASGSATPTRLDNTPPSSPVILPTGHAKDVVVFINSDQQISVFRRKYFCNRLYYVTDLARVVGPHTTAESSQIGPDSFTDGEGQEMELFFANTGATNATVSLTMIARQG